MPRSNVPETKGSSRGDDVIAAAECPVRPLGCNFEPRDFRARRSSTDEHCNDEYCRGSDYENEHYNLR